MRPTILALSCIMLAGCATPPPRAAGPDRAALRDAVASAAQQVKRCYQGPRALSRAAKRVTTVLSVRYAPDGSLIGTPVIVSQSGITADTAFEATQIGQAAIGAVVRCSPIGMPPQLYAGGWDSFELTFSYGQIA